MKQQAGGRSLTEGPVLPGLVGFAVPMFLSLLLQTLYGTVDVLVIGNFGSTAGVSAVATGSQVLMLATYLIAGFTTAATVLIGQYLGARDEKNVAQVIGGSIPVFVCMSVFFAAVMVLLHPAILTALNVPAEAMPQARLYTLICSCGIPLIVGYNAVCAVLRGMGDSKSPLMFVLVACCVNIAGDLLLTGALQMGAAGVAIATVTAQGVSFLISLIFLAKRGIGVPFSRANIRFDGRLTRKLFRLGVPLAVQSIMINLSFLFITAIINAMGVTASAAMGVGDKITGFAFLPQSAFSQAVQVFTAQNVGAGKPGRASRSMWYAAGITAVWGVCFVLLCNTAPTLLPGLFSSDAAVVEMTGLYVRAYSFDVLLTCAVFCMNGFLAGCGCAGFSMVTNLLGAFAVRIPVTYVLSRVPGVTLFMIGLAAPAASVVQIVVTLVYLRTGRWKRKLIAADTRE